MMQDNFSELLELAVREDLGKNGDVSSEAIGLESPGQGRIIARESGVLSGVRLMPSVFKRYSSAANFTNFLGDGEVVSAGTVIGTVTGPIGAVLGAERVALNFLGFLSGIATVTARYVSILKETGSTRLLDTRKTLPGYRALSKQAVLDGGGDNHRQGLYDMIMLKDNHVDAAGGIVQAVTQARARFDTRFPLEVECRNMEEVVQALDAGADIVMLDNMSVAECRNAVALRNSTRSPAKLEASGDMDEQKIRDYGSIGLDYISVGRLTHSVRNLNVSLLYDERIGENHG